MSATVAPQIDIVGLADAARLIGTRRSIRRTTSEPVPTDVIERLLECAIAAPSAHNRQPWRFTVLRGTASKDALAGAMGARLAADRAADGDAPAAIAADVARSRERIAGAPVVIVLAATLADMDAYPDSRRGEAERTMALQSVAMAAQNLLLAAHAAGLAACWMCAPLFCADTVRSVLGLPEAWMPQALVTLGHPAARPKPRARRPLADVTRWID